MTDRTPPGHACPQSLPVGEENSATNRAALPRRSIIGCDDVWFEPVGDEHSRLRLGFPTNQLRAPEEGVLLVPLAEALVLEFALIGQIRGVRIFEATRAHPADDPGLASRGRLLRLSASRRKVSPDAS